MKRKRGLLVGLIAVSKARSQFGKRGAKRFHLALGCILTLLAERGNAKQIAQFRQDTQDIFASTNTLPQVVGRSAKRLFKFGQRFSLHPKFCEVLEIRECDCASLLARTQGRHFFAEEIVDRLGTEYLIEQTAVGFELVEEPFPPGAHRFIVFGRA